MFLFFLFLSIMRDANSQFCSLSQRTTSSLLALFPLQDGESNDLTSVGQNQANSTFGNLTVNLQNGAAWPTGFLQEKVGLTFASTAQHVVRAQTSSNAEGQLYSALSASPTFSQGYSLTLEVWLQPAATPSTSSAIVGLSNFSSGGDWQLFYEQGTNTISFQTLSPLSRISGVALTPGMIYHIIILIVYTSLPSLSLTMLVNGSPVVGGLTFVGITWKPGELNLGAADVTSAWSGSILLVALYTQQLSSSQIQANYNAFVGQKPCVAHVRIC